MRRAFGRAAAAAVCAVMCVSCGGCGTVRSERAFDAAAPGMSRAAVVRKVGHPAIVRGFLKGADGRTIEVWEYKVGCAKSFERVLSEASFTLVTGGAGAPLFLSAAETDRYWFYFIDGAFAGWSPAGDWERDADRICRMDLMHMQNSAGSKGGGLEVR